MVLYGKILNPENFKLFSYYDRNKQISQRMAI